ncbi:hypothetical protein [Treponema sp.]|uniref:hypothetical protein n=1 Tax=Treponema sp. TaxID=166 RepID=UPI00298DB2DD|nr:hypothetical protein [Treponema sp.]MCR5614014.1 hypothetical protein [Treponema sp.]
MNKKFLTTVICFILSIPCFCEAIKIADITFLNEKGEKTQKKYFTAKLIEKHLCNKWFDNKVNFSIADYDASVDLTSLNDAEKFCVLYECNFLLFGFIKESSTGFYSELKLYNHNSKKIEMHFFSADDKDHYQRLVEELCSKVEIFVKEKFLITENIQKEDEYSTFSLSLPLSVFYWNPLDDRWTKVLHGIAGTSVALEIFPALKRRAMQNKSYNFSVRVETSYKAGIGSSDFYPVNYHSFSVSTPVLLNIQFGQTHYLLIGVGPLYQLDVAEFVPKYEGKKTIIQNDFGIMTVIGYQYKLNDSWRLNAEIEFDYYFSKNSFFVIKPKIGAVWNFYKETGK